MMGAMRIVALLLALLLASPSAWAGEDEEPSAAPADAEATVNPAAGHTGVWDGFTPITNGGSSDIRFTCMQDPDGNAMDVDLSPEGAEATRRLGEAFAGESVDRVISSDLERALAMGRGIAASTGAELVVTQELREVDRGRWQGIPREQFVANWIADAALYWADPWNWKSHGGDSDADLWTRGGAALAAIGLISFAGVAQILPALVGGLFWRGATRSGALAGLTVGFAIWLYTMLLPALGGGLLPEHILREGLFGLAWLRPQALFGIEGQDPTVHAVMWSMSLNALAFCLVSLMSFPSPIERLQGAQFVNVFDHSAGPRGWTGSVAQCEDLMIMSQRILGASEAQAFFQRERMRQGGRGPLPEPTPAFLERLERELSASIGAAAAHAMIGQIVGGSSVSVQDLLAVADETAQMLEYSSRLEAQSAELSATARKLRETNEKLTQISEQKDAFLSQVSHELRTPMTSIRAFSEILRDDGQLSVQDQRHYAGIIHDETLRLTRLLNDLLDLSVLENGQVSLNMTAGTLGEVLDHAVSAALAGSDRVLKVHRNPEVEAFRISSDLDRLAQVFINLIANAQKYCDAEVPELTISASAAGGRLHIDFTDNGSGVPADFRQMIFEKFSRVSPERAGGAGLGLAICREVMQRLGGDVSYLPGQGGGAFRVSIPAAGEKAA